MPNTGEKCSQKGPYRAQCIHRTEQDYQVGETFQPCPECEKDVEWIKLPDHLRSASYLRPGR